MPTSKIPLRVLLTNLTLAGRSGTEIVTRDLALGLLRAGHRPTVFTLAAGQIARELRSASIPVVQNIAAIEGEFDIIHGNHLIGMAGVLARFYRTPAISVCHDFLTWWDLPPLLANVARYVAVSENLVERLTLESGIPPALVDLVPNGIDLDRFEIGPRLAAQPLRALAFAKNGEHIAPIRDACAERGIQLDFIGSAVGRIVDAPEAIMGQYDLVFSSALSALESIACGRATIVVDGRGLAGFVDEARYEKWRPHNFGLKVLTRRPTKAAILEEIDRYDAGAAQAACARVRAEAGLDQWVGSYLRVYEKAIASFQTPDPDVAARAWARHLEVWSPRLSREWPWMEERARLVEQSERLAAGLEIAPLDAPLSFAQGGAASRFIALDGFRELEPWGVWSTLSAPSVRLRLPPAPKGLTLDLGFAAFTGDAPADITILANGEPLTRWTEPAASGWTTGGRMLSLPADLCTGASVWLTFKAARPGVSVLARPPSAQENPPPRLGLISFTFRRPLHGAS